jgi:hypothetical protein
MGFGNKFNVPSAGKMEHKLDGTGNYTRYSENLITLFNEDGTMKPGEEVAPKFNVECGSCLKRDSYCGNVVIKGSRLGCNEE